MIDNCGITVKVTTTDRIMTLTGNLFIGGAFMGNNVELNENGDVIHTTAFQEVNPEVLEKADKEKKGKKETEVVLPDVHKGDTFTVKDVKSAKKNLAANGLEPGEETAGQCKLVIRGSRRGEPASPPRHVRH